MIETVSAADNPGKSPVILPLRTHLGRLSTGVLIYGLTGALSRTATLLLVPVLTAYLTTADHGVLALLTVLVAVLSPVCSVGLGAALGACYFTNPERSAKVATIWSACLLVFPGASLLVLGAVMVPSTFSEVLFGTPDLARPVRVTLISTALGILSLPFMLYLQFEERAGSYARIMLSSTAITVVGILAGLAWFDLGLDGVVFATMTGQATLLAALLWTVTVHLRPARVDRGALRALVLVGLPLVPGFALVLLQQHGNKFVLDHFEGLGSLGVYSLGFNLGFALSVAVAAFQTAWLPFAMSFATRPGEASVVFGRVLTYYVIGGGLLTTMFFVGARPVVLLLAAPAFHGAAQVVGLSAAAQFFSGMLSILLPALYFARQVQYVTLVHALATIVTLACSLVLIPRLNVLGAGLSLAVGAAVSPVLQHAWNVAQRERYLQVQYDWRRVITSLVVYGTLAGVTLWPRGLPLTGELLFASAIGAACLISGYCLLTRDERTNLRTAASAIPSYLVASGRA